MTERKAVIKNADMSEDMQQDCIDCAIQAMEKYNIEKDIAAYIKKVGQSFSILFFVASLVYTLLEEWLASAASTEAGFVCVCARVCGVGVAV